MWCYSNHSLTPSAFHLSDKSQWLSVTPEMHIDSKPISQNLVTQYSLSPELEGFISIICLSHLSFIIYLSIIYLYLSIFHHLQLSSKLSYIFVIMYLLFFNHRPNRTFFRLLIYFCSRGTMFNCGWNCSSNHFADRLHPALHYSGYGHCVSGGYILELLMVLSTVSFKTDKKLETTLGISSPKRFKISN